MATHRQRYGPHGLIALEPKAYGAFFETDDPAPPDVKGGIAVVAIRGPLMHHRSWWFDSYDDIRARVGAALEAKPDALVLSIDSPGGLVSGCFESATALREAAAAAGVPVWAYCDGQTSSAAYALACAASKIYAPATALVGSIGVLDALIDATAADEQYGVKVQLIASGKRKTDGNPHQAISDEAIAAAQGRVDELAAHFFEHVANSRPAMTVETVRGLEAAQVTGAHAERVGLVDGLASFDELLALVADEINAQPAGARTGGRMAATKTKAGAKTKSGPKAEEETAEESKLDQAIALLREAAEDEDEEMSSKAKRMLAAMDEEPDGDEEEKTDEEAKALAAEVASLRKENELLLARVERAEGREADDTEAKAVALVDAAVASGKILKTERDDYLDIARTDMGRAQRLLGRVKPAVPTQRQAQRGEARQASSSSAQLTEAEEYQVKNLVEALGWSRAEAIEHMRSQRATH